MNKFVFLLLVLSAFGYLAGYALTNNHILGFNFCDIQDIIKYTHDAGCLSQTERAGDALSYGFGALSLVFLTLLFVPKALSLWWKFAIWYVPLAALVFAFGEVNQGGWVKLLPDMEEIMQWMSMFYIVVSLFLIGYVFFSERIKK